MTMDGILFPETPSSRCCTRLPRHQSPLLRCCPHWPFRSQELLQGLGAFDMLVDHSCAQKLLHYVDKDGDGTITFDEFLGRAREALLMVPDDGPGFLDRTGGGEEGTSGNDGMSGAGRPIEDTFRIMSHHILNNEDRIKNLFEAMDTDGSGELDARELQVAFEELGARMHIQECRNIIGLFDTDGSGSIQRDEFIRHAKDIIGGMTGHTLEVVPAVTVAETAQRHPQPVAESGHSMPGQQRQRQQPRYTNVVQNAMRWHQQ